MKTFSWILVGLHLSGFSAQAGSRHLVAASMDPKASRILSYQEKDILPRGLWYTFEDGVCYENNNDNEMILPQKKSVQKALCGPMMVRDYLKEKLHPSGYTQAKLESVDHTRFRRHNYVYNSEIQGPGCLETVEVWKWGPDWMFFLPAARIVSYDIHRLPSKEDCLKVMTSDADKAVVVDAYHIFMNE